MHIDYKKLIFAISLPLLAGFIGSYFTISSVSTWYVTLNKPPFSPPNWLFGPVWTILYILMGISFYLILIAKKKSLNKAVIFFYIQLLLNFLWSLLFFGLKNELYGFIDIILLWLAIVGTIYYSYKLNKISAYIMIPYILWVTFAAVLNYYLLILN